MATITKDGITFSNVQNRGAKGYSQILTSADNVSSKKYVYDPDSDPVLMALDIDWNGAEITSTAFPSMDRTINTTGDLLS